METSAASSISILTSELSLLAQETAMGRGPAVATFLELLPHFPKEAPLSFKELPRFLLLALGTLLFIGACFPVVSTSPQFFKLLIRAASFPFALTKKLSVSRLLLLGLAESSREIEEAVACWEKQVGGR